MEQTIEQIIQDIENAPKTFINLAMTTDDSTEVLGPMALGNEDNAPKYGFTDDVISAVISGNYGRVIDGSRVDLCGSFFDTNARNGDGAQALPLMMRLARAGIIKHTNYSEGYNLDAWRATPEAGAEMELLVKEMHFNPRIVKLGIRNLLRSDSPVQAGRLLHNRIIENYR